MIEFKPQFTKFFPYTTDEEKTAQVEKIVEQVVDIYQKILKAKMHSEESIQSLRKRGFWFDGCSRQGPFPSTFEIKHFGAILKKKLSVEVKRNGSVSLITGYSPEKLLKNCLYEAGITREKYPDYAYLFPYKSCTAIYPSFDSKASKLGYRLSVRFRIQAI